jgi:hypothetical protein
LRGILNQRKQIILYRRLGFHNILASAAGLSVSIFGEPYSGIKFSNPFANGGQRYTRRFMDKHASAMSSKSCIGSHYQTAGAL